MKKLLQLLAASAAFFVAPLPALALAPSPNFAIPPVASNPYPGQVNNSITRVMQNRATTAGIAAGDAVRVNTTRAMAASAASRASALLGTAGRALSWAALLASLPSVINKLIDMADNDVPAPPGSGTPATYKPLGNVVEMPGLAVGGTKPPVVPAFSTNDPKVQRASIGPDNWGFFEGSHGWVSGKTCFGNSARALVECVVETIESGYKAGPRVAYKGIGANGQMIFHRARFICRETACGGSPTNPRAYGEADRTVGIDDVYYFAPAQGCDTGIARAEGQGSDGRNTEVLCLEGMQPSGLITAPNVDAPWYVVEGQKNRPLSNQTVADLVNGLWQDAAGRDGYNGLPFPLNAPVTADEVAQTRAQNAAAWPTVGDLNAPVADGAKVGTPVTVVSLPANGTLTAADPKYTADPASGTLPSANAATPGSGAVTVNATVDLGPDPNIAAPALEAAPTAASIIDPLFNIFPGLDVEIPNGTCPTWSFDALGETFQVEQHCSIMEEHRAAFSVVFLALWTLAAAMIILRA